MPSADFENKPSWADQVEQGEAADLPPSKEEFDVKTGIKKITEYKYNSEGKKVKVVSTYKVETIKVSKSIANRKTWKKFGSASGDPPGPNPANTVVSEETFMQFVHNKEVTDSSQEEDTMAKLKTHAKLVSCRICKGDHWTTKCPYKDTLSPMQQDGVTPAGEDKPVAGDAAGAAATPQKPAAGGGKYIPPSLRGGDGTKTKGESMYSKTRDETATIRVTNLSEDTRESDLQDLFKPFGSIQRIFLAKDKNTGQSKGFAFINYHRKEDAARAIQGVSGFGYDHLILTVEWAKPSGNAN